ncbi:Clp protease N-terminal domain-containing protein [Nocardia sp. CNY236]|uniref:Clp protease N-terminal domain-containing protein n=1 Tax=Nocardia sp. CNY236 TaxID=1169152 RepID=UPI0003F6B0B5|nr:Clp protease N-terminal domain-containing protein [Nocardia sp. CNY236]
MFERFSRSAKSVVVGAQTEARSLRSSTIDVEHLLLGLLAQGEPELTALLVQSGITRDGVRRKLSESGKGDPLGVEDAEALRSIGIDLDAVRESLQAHFGEDALDDAVAQSPRSGRSWGYRHIPFTKDAKKVLESALREAVSRKDKTIESGHILLGILRVSNQTTLPLFVTAAALDDLRPKVHALLDRVA